MKKTCIALFLFLSFHNLGIAQNIIGSFQHIKSRVMGGYRISSTSNLEISRNEKKEIRYFVITTVVDEYNGSVPRIEETSGVIKLINNKYKFIGGSYAERGAYILLNNKMNSKVLISFAPGRGDAMLFDKKVIIDNKIDNNSLNSSLDVKNDFKIYATSKYQIKYTKGAKLDWGKVFDIAFKSEENNFNSWRLPTIDELKEIYSLRHSLGITSGVFWSSTLHPPDRMGLISCLDFSNGDDGILYNEGKYYYLLIKTTE
jgi:hypothetical protein